MPTISMKNPVIKFYFTLIPLSIVVYLVKRYNKFVFDKTIPTNVVVLSVSDLNRSTEV